ncbi:ATP-binding protein [Azospirillum sp. SYSU D00513]|uniref:ATP-binding response regulator n=1 Tax=Azospirillum sp. SYSU D00513 TaxID=2812561 RepID=UPI001A96DA14|nr:ATP-binding protein [Azospirillum sp. SYSU D00513]
MSVLLSVGLVSILGGGFYALTRHQLLEQYEASLQASATTLANQTNGLLAVITDTMARLSQNGVLATALVDSSGRETYLVPFLNSYRSISGIPVSITFTDFEGEVIATNGEPGITGQDMAWLRAAIARGSAAAAVVSDNGILSLIAAEMLVYDRTESPEGAVLYKVPLDALVPYGDARIVHAVYGTEQVPSDDGRIVVEIPLQVSNVLVPLKLALRMTAPPTPTAGLFRWMLPLYIAAGLLAIGLVAVAGSRLAGRYLTRSLRDLEELSSTIVRDGYRGQRAAVRGRDEVARLANAFNHMLDELSAARHELEERSALEIAAQRDLAERADAARSAMERARNEAERANAAKTRFLAAASHDLRQPVQSLMLLTSALGGKMAGREDAKPLLGHMETALEALRHLLDSLLDISKLEAGVIQAEFQTVRLSDLLSRLEGEYNLRGAESGIAVRVVPCTLSVRTDPALLERMLRNLLENALRYTQSGGILIGCRRSGGAVRLQILDTGIGIPQDQLDDIFQEFYQVGNAGREREKGLGLGLAIVRRLSHLLRHPVRVTSAVGKGSCFSVELPLVATAPVQPCAEAEGSPSHERGFAVVIDDEALVRESLGFLIESYGWRVLMADSGDAALSRLSATPEPPTLVIADYRLENGKSGIDAVRRLQETYGPGLRGVILTGDTAPERIAEAQSSGHLILHKPISAAVLRGVLADAHSA